MVGQYSRHGDWHIEMVVLSKCLCFLLWLVSWNVQMVWHNEQYEFIIWHFYDTKLLYYTLLCFGTVVSVKVYDLLSWSDSVPVFLLRGEASSDPIKWFNPAIVLCLPQARPRFSPAFAYVCHYHFYI